MTTVRYDREHLEMSVSGHSGAGKTGEDIVCAGISTLAQTLLFHAQEHGEFNPEIYMEMQTPVLKISCTPASGDAEKCRWMYDVIYTGFELMAENYPDYVILGG